MIDGIKMTRIPQVPNNHSIPKREQDPNVFNEIIKELNIDTKKYSKRLSRKPERKAPTLKVRQLPMKSLEFRPTTSNRVKIPESSPNTSQIIKTRMVLNTSFRTKKDQSYIQEKYSNRSDNKPKTILEVPNVKAMKSYKHLTRMKYLLSNSRIPTSEDQFCLAKSTEEIKANTSNMRLNSFLNLFKKKNLQ